MSKNTLQRHCFILETYAHGTDEVFDQDLRAACDYFRKNNSVRNALSVKARECLKVLLDE